MHTGWINVVMKIAGRKEQVLFRFSALMLTLSFQVCPALEANAEESHQVLLAAGDSEVDTQSRASGSSGDSAPRTTSTVTTVNAKSRRQTTTMPAPRNHAGATIIDDDTTISDTDQANADKPSSNDKAALVSDYKESAATEALCKQAATYTTQKQYSQAIAVLTTAITRDPRTIVARRLYAEANLLNNQPERAVQMMVALAKYAKPTVYDKCLLGSGYYAQRNSGLAVVNFRDATVLAPANFYAEQGLLKSLLLAQEFDGALAECAAAFKRYPDAKAQVALKGLYAQIQRERQVSRAGDMNPTGATIAAPIPLEELTPYMAKREYGG
jgi:tetratricopeptide (TPR) repeat protein